jgi:hypothetical protein
MGHQRNGSNVYEAAQARISLLPFLDGMEAYEPGKRLIIGFVTLLPFLGAIAAPDLDLCGWRSKTPPDVLQGYQGSSDADEYWFNHLSDVDQIDHKRIFVFVLRNLHPRNCLPAEWVRGSGEPQLAFSRLAPGKCGTNSFETSNSFLEDKNSVIKYGPGAQFTKQDAALYLKVDVQNESVPTIGPRMKSSLVGVHQTNNGQNENIHLDFETQSEGKQFAYTVTNLGRQQAKFRIPQLSEAWSKPGTKTLVSKWKTERNTFLAEANGKPISQIIYVEASVKAKEAQVPIQLVSPDGETVIASGQVTAYLPEFADSQ